MTRFAEWCSQTETQYGRRKLQILVATPSKRDCAVAVVAASIPENYASPARISGLLSRLGRAEVAKYIAEKLPTSLSIKSGDLGEILCTAYVHEATTFNLGIKRLRWKDHRNMAMRGDDVLAFSLNVAGQDLKVLKAEVKSRAKMQTKVIDEARAALSDHRELPSAHAIGFVADRLGETGNRLLQDALDNVQLEKGFKKSQVTHMLFALSGNDPSKMLSTNLAGYAGTVFQHYVGVRISDHKNFINDVFAAVGV